jgi:hydroxymethylglutaryl-CoA lyase
MKRVFLNEVAPRDGLQMESHFVPTTDKIAFVDALSDCGFATIEVTAFVSAKAIPALADAEAVLAQVRRRPGVRYSALVPNQRGLERALEVGVDEVNLVMSSSEAHNQANLRMSRATSEALLLELIAKANAAGVASQVSLSTAFGCPFEGAVAHDEVLRLAERMKAGGASGITLCDTTGMADPASVRRLVRRVADVMPLDAITLHLHDTRGLALANALAGYEEGVTRFDGSCAGLGGCPYAPGASGNVGSEALAHLFRSMGVQTGVDLDRLLSIAREVPALVQRGLDNPLLRAGPLAAPIDLQHHNGDKPHEHPHRSEAL